MSAELLWSFASGPDAERWVGPFPTKHAAIAEALAYYGDPDDGFRPCVATCRARRPEDDGDETWTFIIDGEPEVIDAAHDAHMEAKPQG